MAYIGKQPVVGNFQVCDAISVVNGQAAYTMQVASTNVEPENANHMLVSLNGVLQKPGSSFTISGSTITFASNLVTNDVIDFIILLGDVLNIGTPSDDTVTAAKLNNDIISGQTALTAAPDDTDEFLVSDAGTIKRIDYSLIKGGGKIAQVVQTVKTDTFSTTSTSMTDITGMSVAITPSATSSKVLVMVDLRFSMQGAQAFMNLLRGSTVIFNGTAASNRPGVNQSLYSGDPNVGVTASAIFLDSPSSTSETTYKLQAQTLNSSYTIGVNRGQNDDDQTDRGRYASSITAMEVLA